MSMDEALLAAWSKGKETTVKEPAGMGRLDKSLRKPGNSPAPLLVSKAPTKPTVRRTTSETTLTVGEMDDHMKNFADLSLNSFVKEVKEGAPTVLETASSRQADLSSKIPKTKRAKTSKIQSAGQTRVEKAGMLVVLVEAKILPEPGKGAETPMMTPADKSTPDTLVVPPVVLELKTTTPEDPDPFKKRVEDVPAKQQQPTPSDAFDKSASEKVTCDDAIDDRHHDDDAHGLTTVDDDYLLSELDDEDEEDDDDEEESG